MTKKMKVYYFSMIGSMFIRLFWLIFREPFGARKVGLNHQNINSLPGFAAHTIPFVVYPSIIILIIIIIGVFLSKKWSYIACFIFGLVHLLLVLPLVIMRVSPGYGPIVVIPACILMMVFSGLMMKNTKSL